MKNVLYKAEKTITKANKIDNFYYNMKIRLSPFEAKMLLDKNVNVYEETIEHEGGCRKHYFVYCNIDALASVAQ
jgi:hypothetical protein